MLKRINKLMISLKNFLVTCTYVCMCNSELVVSQKILIKILTVKLEN